MCMTGMEPAFCAMPAACLWKPASGYSNLAFEATRQWWYPSSIEAGCRGSRDLTAIGKGPVWDGSAEYRQRRYDSYDAYIEHQASKLRLMNLSDYTLQFKAVLSSRIGPIEKLLREAGTTVLCLGARNGAECEVFVERGFFAIGIDLNPGEGNRFVVKGDFHELQFADASIDVVFTNALDHAYELKRIISEIKRVLRPGGLFVAEVVRGSKDEDGREPGAFEAAWWDHASVVADEIEAGGLERLQVTRFEKPWVGDQYVFRRPRQAVRGNLLRRLMGA